MTAELLIQGRQLGSSDVVQIRSLLEDNPSWHRTRLSRHLCQLWDWRNQAGQPKDMACRSLLLKLERRGIIELPPRQRASVNGSRNRRMRQPSLDTQPLASDLHGLHPLRIEPMERASAEISLFGFLLQQYHYLSYRNCVGENLKYLVQDSQGRPLACVLFGAAAWKCQSRDAFIGWDAQQRARHLPLLANNCRFLILPWVRVPHLASYILGAVARRISRDWQDKYGHPILMLETFVEQNRFAGTCYRAAGWRQVGATTGRSRNATASTPLVPVKDVYLKALDAHWQGRLAP